MTTYTTLNADGYVMDRGLSLNEAADAIMTSDSREWAIRMSEPGYYTAWARQYVANRGWVQTVFTAYNTDGEAAACDSICQQIVNAERMHGHCEAMTDAAYDRMIAEPDEINHA